MAGKTCVDRLHKHSVCRTDQLSKWLRLLPVRVSSLAFAPLIVNWMRPKVHEMIIISLFDEVEFDDHKSGGFLEDETATRKEKRFLGSLVLPFQVTGGR